MTTPINWPENLARHPFTANGKKLWIPGPLWPLARNFTWVNGIGQILLDIGGPLAAELLRYDLRNRTKKDFYIAQYRDLMLEEPSRWLVNTSGIGFDWDGVLMNGLNRLSACVEANKKRPVGFPTNLYVGLSPDAIHTEDSGARKTGADRLVIDTPGHRAYATDLSALINGLDAAARGDITKTFAGHRLDAFRQREWDRGYPWLPAACKLGRAVVGKRYNYFSPKMASLLVASEMWLGHDPGPVETFLAAIASEVGHTSTRSPEVLYRRRINDHRVGKYGMSGAQKFALLCKAWLFKQTGESVTTLRFREGGSAPEEYPTPPLPPYPGDAQAGAGKYPRPMFG